MKTLILALLLCTAVLSVNAQTTTQVTPTSTATAPAKIGPAPANSKQKQILSKALSPETKSTLQEAMDSVR